MATNPGRQDGSHTPQDQYEPFPGRGVVPFPTPGGLPPVASPQSAPFESTRDNEDAQPSDTPRLADVTRLAGGYQPAAPVPVMTPELVPPALQHWLVGTASRACLPLEYVVIPAMIAASSLTAAHIDR